MLWRLFNGEKISTIYPTTPESGRAFNVALCRRFGVLLPEASDTDSEYIVLE
jgi:hypothetical protein